MSNRFDKQLGKIKQNRKLFAILLFAFMGVVMWVFMSLASSQKEVKIDPKLIDKSKPLVPYLDEDVFIELEAKKGYLEESLDNFTIYRILEDEEEQEIYLEEFNRDSANSYQIGPTPTLDPTQTPNLLDETLENQDFVSSSSAQTQNKEIVPAESE